MKQPAAVRPEGGFTLIEVMISILLAAIAVVGILALYMTETRASGFSRHSTEASALATDKLEKLRTVASSTLATACSTTDTLIDPRGVTGVTGSIYTRSCTSTAYTPSGTTLYYNLTVTVSWDENGVTRSVVLRGRRNT